MKHTIPRNIWNTSGINELPNEIVSGLKTNNIKTRSRFVLLTAKRFKLESINSVLIITHPTEINLSNVNENPNSLEKIFPQIAMVIQE
ncbi:MAG: hypothetical protein IPJ32_00630 [Sphingobacteriaceae bacterium]|nr:hypothetical protein [Sphingobacteriaceae bacterium]